MKSVLLSIQPKWCELIASGEKTVEIRKTRPKIEPPFKCYIYCTINGTTARERDRNIFTDLRGKVIGEFICNMIVGVKCPSDYQAAYNRRQNTCVTDDEIMEYAKDKEVFYWHISDLVIYEKPKSLIEFQKYPRKLPFDPVQRPPQSWCYVEKESD